MSTVGTVDGKIGGREQDMKHKSMSQMNKERKLKNKSVFKDKKISNDYKSGGAYKAILNMFAEQLDDEKFAEHCRKFFKGDKNERKDTD